MRALTIGQLARHAGVSRSTLLHYEKRGLLLAQGRSDAGYRLYGEASLRQLDAIRSYRATGMPLDQVARLLKGGDKDSLIRQRIDVIAEEMAALQEQQAVLLRLIGKKPRRPAPDAAVGKQAWTAMLRSAGLDDAGMQRWHALFEKQSPQAHAVFLSSLGMEQDEVKRIRAWARGLDV
jgi:DNA-binding transcriptional MerR regulator